MPIELKVPDLGESITEVELGPWLRQPGDPVQKDEPLVALESQKATVELPAPAAGTIQSTLKQKGDVAKIGEVIGYLEIAEAGSAPPSAPPQVEQSPAPTPKPKAANSRAEPAAPPAEPARSQPPEPKSQIVSPPPGPNKPVAPGLPAAAPLSGAADREEETVPMSRLRRTVAERLVEAQRNAALLTTFNEIDLGVVIALRQEHGEAFQRKHGVKLGFMSFFVKAAVEALKQFPAINAELRGSDIIYHNYYDIGVAIGGGKGLVVPVLRNAERLSFAAVETTIADFARRARENRIKPDELAGGTFTISNGGVYGSLLSTPIVNPPQSGVLGMHVIQDRPVARAGAVVIRPMMYVALTYDHRLVDGREAVSFLKRVKEILENPARMLIEV